MWRAYPLMGNSLKEISKSTGIKWEDLRNAIDKEEKAVFTDSVHLTDLGQDLLADIIFEEIKADLY